MPRQLIVEFEDLLVPRGLEELPEPELRVVFPPDQELRQVLQGTEGLQVEPVGEQGLQQLTPLLLDYHAITVDLGDLCQAELAEASLLGGLPRLLLCQVALLVLLKELAEPVQVDVVPVFEAVYDDETALERAVRTVRH